MTPLVRQIELGLICSLQIAVTEHIYPIFKPLQLSASDPPHRLISPLLRLHQRGLTPLMSFAASSLFSRLFRPFSTGSPVLSLNAESQARNMSNTEKATIAAGCFWGVEQLFRKQFGNGKGLLDAKVGYCEIGRAHV